MAIVFVIIHFTSPKHQTPMNWGWIVITISALSNIRRITQKIESKKIKSEEKDISKMYREDLEKKIEHLEKVNFDLRFKNIKLQDPKK
jgi:hypothetical protein